MRVKQWLAINGVQMSALKYKRITDFRAMLPQLDERERLNSEDIAARLQISAGCVRSWLRILGHRLHNNNGRTIFRHNRAGWADKILPVYKANNYNSQKTADDLKMDRSVVYRWLANEGHLKTKHAQRDITSYKFQNYR
jgi:hypothetical protein